MCRMVFNLREEVEREQTLLNKPEGTLGWEVYHPANASRQESTIPELESVEI